MNQLSKRFDRRRGFTLMEVMLVLVILVIIGSVATVAVVQMQRNANIQAAKAQVLAFEAPLQAYHMNIGDYPSNSDGLQALRTVPSGLPNPSKWAGPYLNKEVPLDPWGNSYRYEYPPKRQTNDMPDIWSLGPDQSDGTEDDIGNWETIQE